MRDLLPRLTAVALFLSLNACTALIRLPEAPAETRPAFVLEHGRHSSLVLTNADGVPVRYAFGDLDWYAHNNTGLFRGMSALLTPTAGTLGRRELAAPATVENILLASGVHVEAVHCFAASARRVDRLVELLDGVFNANRATLHYNRGMNLEFVEAPKPFWIANNANTAVADWLEKLGAKISGSTALANWKVAYPDDETPEACRKSLLATAENN